MANNCLVTKLKGVVNNDSLKKLGETLVEILPSMELNVTWSDFDPSKDSIRVVSGNATISSITNGIKATADANGCVVGVSNKYSVNSFNSAGNTVGYILNADDFKNCNNRFSTISRVKVRGDISNISSNLISYFLLVDLSESNGNLDLSKVEEPITFALGNAENVSLIATGNFSSYPVGYDGVVFKESVSPIPLSYWDVTATVDAMLCRGIKWQGNIETDFNPAEAINRIRLDGTQLTGQLEKFIEKLITTKTDGSAIRIASTSNMTFNGQILDNFDVVFTFYSDTIVAKIAGTETVVATYTKATGAWTYSN